VSRDIRRTIGRTFLSYVIGSKWQTFIGTAYPELCDQSQVILDELGWEYRITDESVSTTEAVMFGSEDATEFNILSPEFTIRTIPVTYDPLQRFVFGNVLSRETRDDYRNKATLVEISPITTETEPAVALFLQKLATATASDPWDIDHPRFHWSPLLRYKVRMLWRYWLNADTVNETTPESEDSSVTDDQSDRETR
jgi:hypothetical protein